MTIANNYVSGLFAPVQKKATGKKSWGFDLETFWLPLLHASNINGDTAIAKDVLGFPVRVVRDKDGEVKFNQNGRITTRIHKDITDQVKAVQSNFQAEAMGYITAVQQENPEAWSAAIESSLEAGRPVAERERRDVRKAEKARREAVEAEARLRAELEALRASKSDARKDKTKELAGATA